MTYCLLAEVALGGLGGRHLDALRQHRAGPSAAFNSLAIDHKVAIRDTLCGGKGCKSRASSYGAGVEAIAGKHKKNYVHFVLPLFISFLSS